RHAAPYPTRSHDVLLAVRLVADDAAAAGGPHVELPDLVAVICIISVEVTLHVAAEYQAALGRKNGGDARIIVPHRPLFLAGHRIPGVERAVDLVARRCCPGHVAADIPGRYRLHHRLLFMSLDDH